MKRRKDKSGTQQSHAKQSEVIEDKSKVKITYDVTRQKNKKHTYQNKNEVKYVNVSHSISPANK